MPNAKPKTIDEYLAGVNAEQRAILEKVRETIHSAAPGAEEYIGYGLAGFKLRGRPLVYFGAWEKHCALYAASPATQKQFQKELEGFAVSKGTIQFTPERPLPAALVKKLVRARAAENLGKSTKTHPKSMQSRTTRKAAKPAKTSEGVFPSDVASVLASLKKLSNARIREEMSSRYGIVTNNAYGVRMRDMQQVAKELGRNHPLALALWETGNYEARTVAGFVADPARVTPALMDRWCRDFDNWAICDTLCFKLLDQVPHAFVKAREWAGRKEEFQKRAGFALMACLAGHDEHAGDKAFLEFLPLIEAAVTDERNFVKKGVSWALRGIGMRNAVLRAAATKLALELASSPDVTARWIGKDALRALTK